MIKIICTTQLVHGLTGSENLKVREYNNHIL